MSVNGLSGEDIPVLCVLHDADLFSKGGKRVSGIKGNFDARPFNDRVIHKMNKKLKRFGRNTKIY